MSASAIDPDASATEPTPLQSSNSLPPLPAPDSSDSNDFSPPSQSNETQTTSADDAIKTKRSLAGAPAVLDPARQEVAYGRRAVPKLISSLSSDSPSDSLTSLTTLSSLLHHPSHLASALSSNLIPSLSRLLASPDSGVRLLAAKACVTVCGQAVGRSAVALDAVEGLKKLALEDPDPEVRKEAYEAIRRVSMDQEGVSSLLRASLIRPAFARLSAETLEVQSLVLQTLYNILRTGIGAGGTRKKTANQALAGASGSGSGYGTHPTDGQISGTIPTSTDAPGDSFDASSTSESLPSPSPSPAPAPTPASVDDDREPSAFFMATLRDLAQQRMPEQVKVGACRCVMMLSFYPEGKRLAVKENLLKPLIALLKDRKSEVRAAAAGAIMSITVDVEAKKQMVRENALPLLVDLISGADRNPESLLNACRCIANCAEDYRGRFQLSSCLKKLEELKGHPNTQLGDAAKRAIENVEIS
ncbi:Radial spoke head 14 [Gonapodya sp. JEL0774]|nr:Radial spoke head 14 [Gonapodya sp. JEL0774]